MAHLGKVYLVGAGPGAQDLITLRGARLLEQADVVLHDALVVRLKGGDPMLFGRADEELRALEAAGIEVEVVPGITTALAAAAATKQPLTQRGVARSVAFFTSSTAPEHAGDQVAVPDTDTLVQYMGGREAIATAQRLLAQGRRPDTPVVVIENCSRADERILRLTLATLARGLGEAHGPVLVMLGDALKMRPHQQVDEGSAAEYERKTA